MGPNTIGYVSPASRKRSERKPRWAVNKSNIEVFVSPWRERKRRGRVFF